MQGKEFDWPQDEKLYALFFNGDTIDWEGELLSIGCEEKVWSEFLDHLENGMEETLDTVVDLSLNFQRGEPLVDTSENKYLLKEINVDYSLISCVIELILDNHFKGFGGHILSI